MSSSRKLPALAAGLALVTTGLAFAPVPVASAAPLGDGPVISEVYGAGGFAASGDLPASTYANDFIELHNPTDTAVDLSGWAVFYGSASRGNPGNVSLRTTLTGTIPPHGHFLVSGAGGSNGTPLPDADAAGSINMAAGSGLVILSDQTETLVLPTGNIAGAAGVVDAVGYGTANTFEGAAQGTALNGTTSANRAADGADTDNNSVDFAVATPTPTNAGSAEPEPEPELVDIDDIQGTGETSPLSGEVTTRGVVTAAYPTGGLNGFYLQTAGTGGAVDLATHDASDGIFVYRGSSTPLGVAVGDHVEVTGAVGEYAGATQLSAFDATDVSVLPEPAEPVVPAVTAWPDTDAEKETLEGMLFTPQGDFTITNNYNTNQYGELGLATGDSPLVQPTQVAPPGSAEAAAVAADNAARAIVLDDASSTNFTASYAYDLTPPYISNTQPFRIGASSAFTEDVILTEGGSPTSPSYRFQPLAQVVGPENTASPIAFPDTRTATPDESLISAEGTPAVKVASFNVLNYFTTLGDADDDNVGDGGCLAYEDRDDDGNNVRGGCDQRGAWDPQDFDRQQSKIVSAVNALDADVVGLMEIENSAALGESPDEAVQSLVAALNADAGAGTWAANPSSSELPDASGQDVITNAIIYRPAAVERTGEARALGDQSDDGEAFGNAREPIAQAFTPVDGGEPFMVVVNHFKSKGSAGPWPGDADTGDGQGASNESRVRQAQALADWVPTVQGDVEDVLLLGDFNSYAQEDPMQVLHGAGYTNLEDESGNHEYSYSFSGQSGSLDHVLANDTALERFTGADVWNINAVEPVAMEYSRWNYHATDFHSDGPFRSSDHDPVVVGLTAGDSAEEPGLSESELTVKVTPKRVWADRTRAKVHVRVHEDVEGRATGLVEVVVDGGEALTCELRGGACRVRLDVFEAAGTHTVEVAYVGDERVAGSTATEEVEVHERRGTGRS